MTLTLHEVESQTHDEAAILDARHINMEVYILRSYVMFLYDFYVRQGSHSCDEAKFKGFSRAFSKGHNKNSKVHFLFEEIEKNNFEKKKKKSDFFFPRLTGGQIKGQASFFKGVQHL